MKLIRLGNKLSKISIFFYPMLILELEDGFYTTEALDLKNQQSKYENLKIELKKKQESNLNKYHFMNNITTSGEYENFQLYIWLNTTSEESKKKKNSNQSEKKKEIHKTEFFQWFQAASRVNSVQEFPLTGYEEELKYRSFMRMKDKNRIEELKFKKQNHLNKIQIYIDEIKELGELQTEIEMVIKEKEKRFVFDGYLKLRQHIEDFKSKEKENEPLNKELERISTKALSLKRERIINIYNIFFNNSIKVFDFNALKDIELEKMKRETSRGYANFMGNSAILIDFIAKEFKIPLRHSLFALGSKSQCLISPKKSFFPLFPEPGKEDKNSRFIEAMNCQKENLIEIIFYFISMFNFTGNDYENFLSIIYKFDFQTLFRLFIKQLAQIKPKC